MMRRIALVLVVLAALGGIAVYSVLGDEARVRALLVERLAQVSGREAAIEGSVGVSWSLTPSLDVLGVRIANAPWAAGPYLARVERMQARLDLLALLGGEIRIQEVILDQVTVHLEVGPDGAGNWRPSLLAPGAPGTGVANLWIAELVARNATLFYRPGPGAIARRLALAELTAEVNGPDGAVVYAASLAHEGVVIRSTGSVTPMRRLLAGESVDFELTLEAPGATASLVGRVGNPHAIREIEAEGVMSLAPAARLPGALGAAIPIAGPFDGRARLSGAPERFELTGIETRGAVGTIDGALRVVTDGAGVTLSGTLHAPELSFAGGNRIGSDGGRLFSTAPLPLDVLGVPGLVVDVGVEVDRLVAAGRQFESVTATVAFGGGRLVANPTAKLGGGTVEAEIAIDARATPPAFEGRISARRVPFEVLAAVPPDQTFVSGAPTDLDLRYRATGTHLAALAASLNGRLLAAAGPGVLDHRRLSTVGGADLVEFVDMINPLAAGRDRARLECAVANFRFDDGVATTDRGLAMESEQITVSGSGAVNLREETLDLGFKPAPRRGANIGVGQLAGLVRLRGALSDPELEADEAGMAVAGVTIGAAVATGGLSLLAQGLIGAINDDPTPCLTARGVGAASRPKATPARGAVDTVTDVGSQAGKAVGAAAGKAAGAIGSAVEGVGKGVGSALKSLFGN